MKILKQLLPICLIGLAFASCQKDSYFIDSGVHDPHFKGTVLQYLASKPKDFDTLIQVIQLAGMEDVFEKDSITFFAPSDSSFRKSLDILNLILLQTGKDTISNLDQISPVVWKSVLSMYVFKGKKLLNDYPQVDLNAVGVFPGQAYQSMGGRPMNIGVIYNDAGGVQYAGYRQLVISYIPSLTAPQTNWITAWVASVNVQPTNGVVHVLRYGDHYFGFDPVVFAQDAIDEGLSDH